MPNRRTALGRELDTDQRIELLERRLARGFLPERLQPNGAEVTDWNEATAVGFYWCENTALNAPRADRFVGEVFVVGGGALAGRIVQEVRIPTNSIQGAATWRRVYDGTWRPWYIVQSTMRGTAAERAVTVPRYWDFWQDTDGSQVMYVGGKSGAWRQYAGSVVAPSRAWDTVQGAAGAALLAGRTDSLTLPTVIEANEDILIWLRTTGSGFGVMGQSAVTRNPTNTIVAVRLMQLMSHSTQAYSLGWQIAPVAV